VRARGLVELGLVGRAGTTVVERRREEGASRVRLPRGEDARLLAMTVNVGGGVASGDRFETRIAAADGAAATLSTAAAERVYRSHHDVARIATRIDLSRGADLRWLPAETILYDGAVLERRVDIAVWAGCRLVYCEPIVFGRTASGESFRSGLLRESLRVRRDGRLVLADEIAIDAAAVASRAGLHGRPAMAFLLIASPEAEDRIEEARRHAPAREGFALGLSAWNGLLLGRAIAADSWALKRGLGTFLAGYVETPLPHAWR
jgi:urease accessory protein